MTPAALLFFSFFLAPALVLEDEKAGADVASALREFERYYSDKNEHVRKAAVMDLSSLDHAAAVEPLLRALGDDSLVVREEAERALEKIRSNGALDLLVERVKKPKSPEQAVSILESFRVTRPESAYEPVLAAAEGAASFDLKLAAVDLLPLLASREGRSEAALGRLLDDKEPLVRLAAIDGLGKLRAESLAPACLEKLAPRIESDWRVRAAAVAALRRLRVKDAIPALIDALEREDGRLRDDCQQALVDLTGDAVPADDAAEWREWWGRAGADFKVPTLAEVEERRKKQKAAMSPYAPPAKKGYAPFVGIETRSKRILFIIDVSSSMSERLVLSTKDPARLAAFIERYGRHDTKIELAREELIETIAALEPHVKFNIATFHSTVETWKPELVAATGGNKSAAIKFLADMTPEKIDAAATATRNSGRTNTFDALNVAFNLAKSPNQKPTKNHKVESDTVFFLSDGMATAGRIQDPGELIRYFTTINARAKIVFHTIAFGHGNESLMQPIAETSGGQYVVIALE